MPGKKGLKLYRVWKSANECRKEEDTVTQAGTGKVIAKGAAATEFVERAVEYHQKRADIHEWHKDKGLTDDEAEPEDDINPPSKKRIKSTSHRKETIEARHQNPTTATTMRARGGNRRKGRLPSKNWVTSANNNSSLKCQKKTWRKPRCGLTSTSVKHSTVT